jgi:hypothetical protein
MTQRYFVAQSAAVYEQARARLDEMFGHPNSVASTCLTPAEDAPKTKQGGVLLAVDSEFCEWPQAAELLPQLLASGAVEEIDEATYRSLLPKRAF